MSGFNGETYVFQKRNHQKFSCKSDFMFFVISSWYFWCLVQFCLIFTWQIFYAAARVSPYFLVRDFGSLFSVSVSRFSSAFQLFILIFFSARISSFFESDNFGAISWCFCFTIYMFQSLSSFKVFYITKKMHCKCHFMFLVLFTW